MKKNTSSNRLTTQTAKGEVRIIAGRWRGRKLPVLNSEGLRPTGDRVKETLFNWLQADIVGAICLDAFAGSGSLGFEALSRQAEQVIFIEKDKKVAQQLNKNLQTLACVQGKVINQNTMDFLNQSATMQFDLVFLDPPFHFDLVQQAVALLIKNNWLKSNCLIYIETEKEKPFIAPENFTLLKQKITGMVSYCLFQFNAG